jgi:hypothetical protein
MCIAASLTANVLLSCIYSFFLSFLLFFLFTSSTRDWVSANYRCSPPTHQQYLDINGKKRKKHNKQGKAAFFFFFACCCCCFVNRLFSQLTMTRCKAFCSFDTLRDSINACWCMSKIVDSLIESIFLLITRWDKDNVDNTKKKETSITK